MIFEIGLPRKVFTSKEEALKVINRNNGMKKAIYKTVYKFERLNGNNKPDYNSAIVDKLFFDFDKEHCYNEALRFHQFLLAEKIKHYIIMSGRGYHVFVLTKPCLPVNSKSCIYNSQHYFIDKLNLLCDTQVVGDNARLHRVANTYHSIANRYCIPLTQNQFYIGDVKIKELAHKQNFVKEIIGEKLFDITPFDYENKNVEDIKFDIGIENHFDKDYINHCPDIIKGLLFKKDLGWKERYLVILYFKERGYTIDETLNILKDNLTEKKFNHCVFDERQLQYLYERDDLVFPERYGINLYK